ncbi:S8 family serine peptidase [Candidatus Uabimicrobium sp. HlEnr_7]|uniref:S8 family peptidase n=1 Tax=Candidatus Uabimicrobium helgolandensis TaxID=3095367 RepID=UPI00355702BB
MLKAILRLFLLTCFLGAVSLSSESPISPKLQQVLKNERNQKISVVVYLKGSLRISEIANRFSSLNHRQSKNQAITLIKKNADYHQASIRKVIDQMQVQNRAQNARYFWLVNAIALNTDAKFIQQLSRRKDVAAIVLNEKIKCIPKQKLSKPSRELKKDPRSFVNSDLVADEDGFFATGFEITVAVLDTGLADAQRAEFFIHPDETSFVIEEPFINDLEGHGTHVAGLIASETFGVAKDATILPIKVLDQFGDGFIVDITLGVEFAAERADILNMSLGIPALSENRKERLLVEKACKNAIKLGRTLVAAAGNSGPDKKTIDSPALVSKVFAVGALTLDVPNTEGQFPGLPAIFSSRGPKGPDFMAPGVDISSLALDPTNNPTIFSGTSQSAPIVAGICAQYLEFINILNDIAAADVKKLEREALGKNVFKILTKSASHGFAKRNITGKGYIDSLSAITGLLNRLKIIEDFIQLDSPVRSAYRSIKENKRLKVQQKR